MTASTSYSCPELARFFGADPKTIAAAIDKGLIAGFKVPGTSRRRVFHRDLMRFLKSDPQYRPLINHIEGTPPKGSVPHRKIRSDAFATTPP